MGGGRLAHNIQHQNRELELKVRLSSADAARLSGDLLTVNLTSGPSFRKKLHSIYFDTPRHDLRAAGMSLRLRHHDGSWVQTLKADQRLNNGVSNPIELEAPVSGKSPDIVKISDKKLQRAVRKAVGKQSLRPIFETLVHRTTRKLKARDSTLELAVDEGEVRTKSATGKLLEAELELKSGSVTGLLLAAETLFAQQDLQPSTESKAERGYFLITGIKRTESSKPGKIKIKPDQNRAEAFSEILRTVTHQIHSNRKTVLETDDPAGPHQMRIGLRRLRSVLRVLRPLVETQPIKDFETAARDVARCVGALRDADVMISTILFPVETRIQNKSGFRELRTILAEERRLAREKVYSRIRSPLWNRLQLHLSIWPFILEQDPGLHHPIVGYARQALERRWRKTSKAARKIQTLTPERRHDLRKSLKELRYLAEFFSTLFDKRLVQRFIQQLKALQDVIGYVNDVRQAGKLRSLGHGHQSALAAGYVLGWHEAEATRAWKRAAAEWRSLKRTTQFWEESKQ